MPVSFQPAQHRVDVFAPQPQQAKKPLATRILQGACRDQFKKCSEIFQSSLDHPSEDNQEIIPRSNGFVDTVIESYSEHRALTIRPDDVWLAILTQFNFFVNANAEQLRKQFVSHEGKKDLRIEAVGSRYTVDFVSMAWQMTTLIDENIVDPTLRDWILPDFSTTTITDCTVSAIVMMATMKVSSNDAIYSPSSDDSFRKGYFKYTFALRCGIPHVTLEGEKKDWEKILTRLEKLKEYGDETTAWYHLLVPVVSRFVGAFDDPNSRKNLKFWQKVAHHEGGGSGPTWISGWINAFCVFDEKGKWKGYPINQVCAVRPLILVYRDQIIT